MIQSEILYCAVIIKCKQHNTVNIDFFVEKKGHDTQWQKY